MLYSGIIKNNKRMNNSFENLENAINQLQQQLNELKTQCVVSEDPGPEIDSAGFTEADREPELKYIFTKEQLIQFAAHLTERTMKAVKEAISEVEVDEEVVNLELSYDNQINIDLNHNQIQDTFIDEINNTIELDNDTLETEIDNILGLMDKQN